MFIMLWTEGRSGRNFPSLPETPTNFRAIVNADALDTQGHNIPIAVIDSGLQREHSDFHSNFVKFWHKTNYEGDHGSSVVSVITAIAPKCEIYFFENFDPLKALEHALHSPAKIINISWSCNYETIHFILLKLAQAGKIIVMSAGNEGIAMGSNFNTRNLLEIAESPPLKGRLLLVASVDYRNGKERLSSYSNYASSHKDPLVCAPGSRILTAISGHRHTLQDGTSFAAPQVTALLAHLMEEFPYHPSEWYVALVKDSARKWRLNEARQVDVRCGYGIIDGKAAMALGRSRQKSSAFSFSKTRLKPVYKNFFNSPLILSDSIFSLNFFQEVWLRKIAYSKLMLEYIENQFDAVLFTQI